MVIGKGGANVDALRAKLNKLTGKQVHINIIEIKQPDLDAHLVGEGIARSIGATCCFPSVHKNKQSNVQCVLELKESKLKYQVV